MKLRTLCKKFSCSRLATCDLVSLRPESSKQPKWTLINPSTHNNYYKQNMRNDHNNNSKPKGRDGATNKQWELENYKGC